MHTRGSSDRDSAAERRRAPLDVLALIDHLPLGGAQMLLAQFAAAAPQAGIRLSVTCLTSLEGNPAARPLEDLGIIPTELGLHGRPGPHAFRVLRSHLAERQPDIVHTHLDTAAWLGGLAARSLKIPVVGTIHSVTPSHPGLEEHVKRMLVRGCTTKLICVSENAQVTYASQHWATQRQLVTIHNGIDVTPAPGTGRALRRELGLGEDDPVVGMVSSLRPEKAHDIAIAAVARLGAQFPALRLLIVGQGGGRARIEHLAAPLGERVVLAGLRTDVMTCFDACDICLHPSRSDAFPTTLIEAMAASVPVLASTVGGIPEIVVDGQTGVLVEPTVDAVTPALARLLDDPSRRARLASAARVRYQDHFTAGPWVQAVRAVYDAALVAYRRPMRATGPAAVGVTPTGGSRA